MKRNCGVSSTVSFMHQNDNRIRLIVSYSQAFICYRKICVMCNTIVLTTVEPSYVDLAHLELPPVSKLNPFPMDFPKLFQPFLLVSQTRLTRITRCLKLMLLTLTWLYLQLYKDLHYTQFVDFVSEYCTYTYLIVQCKLAYKMLGLFNKMKNWRRVENVEF
jgi:hypothetical protein